MRVNFYNYALLLTSFVLACWQPTARSRVLVDALLRAIGRAQLPQKTCAQDQGISQAQWNRQLAGQNGAHPSLFRIGELLMEHPIVLQFWLEEMAILVRAHVLSEGHMLDLMNGLQVLMLEQPRRQRKRMAKADLHTSEQQRERTA
jgi:hypothetical protein